jgi:hypothetical protein
MRAPIIAATVAGLVMASVAIAPSAMGAPAAKPPRCTITGTSGPDRLVGTSGRDVICGQGGDDVIYGLGGDDIVLAGPGDDRLYGGPGDDELYGGPGEDHYFGGAGDDAENERSPWDSFTMGVAFYLDGPPGMTLTPAEGTDCTKNVAASPIDISRPVPQALFFVELGSRDFRCADRSASAHYKLRYRDKDLADIWWVAKGPGRGDFNVGCYGSIRCSWAQGRTEGSLRVSVQ